MGSTDREPSEEDSSNLPSYTGDNRPTGSVHKPHMPRWCNCDTHIAIASGVFGPLVWVVSLLLASLQPSLLFMFVLLWALIYASLPLRCVHRFEDKLLTILIVVALECLLVSYIVNIPFLQLPEASHNSTLQVLPNNCHQDKNFQLEVNQN